MNREYKKDIKIDFEALDIEALNYSEVIDEYRQYAVKARRVEDKAKEGFEYVAAKLDNDLRVNPSNYGLPKVTDPVIKEAVKRQPEYRDAYYRWVHVKHERQSAEAVVKSLEDKKDSLRYLISLWQQKYFEGPMEPRKLGEELGNPDKDEDITAKTLNDGRRRRKKNQSQSD